MEPDILKISLSCMSSRAVFKRSARTGIDSFKRPPEQRQAQFLNAAKYIAHHSDQLQRTQIADAIKYAVRILASRQYAFIPQYRQMLRDIALRCPDLFNDILHADLLVAKHAQNLQAQRMCNRLDSMRRLLNILISVNQIVSHLQPPVRHAEPRAKWCKFG